MPVPDFSSMMLPLLESLKDGKAHDIKSVNETLAWHFDLTDEELSESSSEGGQTMVSERISQAMGHLQNAGLLETASKDFVRITSLGKMVLSKRPNSIDLQYLKRFPKVRE
ncbi:MAG: winged helix-turn-helix domain-containing protein [Cyclobacteriaceae bacterium]